MNVQQSSKSSNPPVLEPPALPIGIVPRKSSAAALRKGGLLPFVGSPPHSSYEHPPSRTASPAATTLVAGNTTSQNLNSQAVSNPATAATTTHVTGQSSRNFGSPYKLGSPTSLERPLQKKQSVAGSADGKIGLGSTSKSMPDSTSLLAQGSDSTDTAPKTTPDRGRSSKSSQPSIDPPVPQSDESSVFIDGRVKDLETRDEYGFPKTSPHITNDMYIKFSRRYDKIRERQQVRWDRIFKPSPSSSSLRTSSSMNSEHRSVFSSTSAANAQALANGSLERQPSSASSGSYNASKIEFDEELNLPKRSPDVKRYIRKGIPNKYRRRCWLHYSGARDKMKYWPGVYQQMVDREKTILEQRRQSNNPNPDKKGSTAANEHIDIIDKDMHRTFPQNYHFQVKGEIPPFSEHFPAPPFRYMAPPVEALRRVLVAYSFYNPVIGYCQSMNYIVGLLLLFMPEEEAFWMIVTITQDILPPGIYTKSMVGTIQETKVLKSFARERCNGVVDKLEKGGIIELEMLISPWFLTLYIHVLPVETVLRVWDCLFYEGSKILYRVALAILKRHESQILKIKDSMEVVQFIQNCPKREINCHRLMKIAFGRFGHNAIGNLAERDIRRKRANVIKEMK